MRFRFFIIITIAFLFSFKEGKTYVSEYFPSGKTKASGWVMSGFKTGYWRTFYENGNLQSKGNYSANRKDGYWFFYTSDGSLLKEGHFKNNSPTKWWIFAKNNGVKEKCLYLKGTQTRYCLVYKNGKLTNASKYSEDKLLQQWTSISSFKHDNPQFKF